MLAKGKRLGANEFGALFHFSETTFTIQNMLFGVHLNVVLREASRSVVLEKGAIASVQDIGLSICQTRVSIRVNSPIFVTDELGHQRRAVSRIFAVENQQCLGRGFNVEKLSRELFLVVEVHSAVDMTAIEFVLKPAVNNDQFFVQVVEAAVKNLNHCLLCDAWKGDSLIIWGEVRKLGHVRCFNIHDRGQQ